MLITYFRSSSFNNWDLCQQQYFLSYTLGIPQDSNKKAEMGTMFHKVMEVLANCNVAVKDGQESFTDSQLGMIPVNESILHTPTFVDRIFNLVFLHYSFPGRTTHHFLAPDKRMIYGWVCSTLENWYGLFDPRKRNIVKAEQHFDLPIEEPWAIYQFENPYGGEPIEGRLHIKGTIDLITQVGPKTYEVIDWKTGKRIDWGTGGEKDFAKLSVDPQLRMYHYALSRLYPEIDHIVMSINYVRDGGPFTMAYGPEDMTATLAMLKIQFEKIKKCTRPMLKSPCGTHWFCTKVCSYGRNPHPKDPNQTICQYIKKKVLREGIQEVIRSETAENHTVNNYDNPGE